ncbi:MAG TPA: ABC transporter substrate-binding protein [Stellaceae bacterium]|nr:ABC transporter substrate-binding protein [Stellaceae bacterium]
MNRRRFIVLLGGVATPWPLSARAAGDVPVIGFLSGSTADSQLWPLSAFNQGLAESGYVEGQNVLVEYRWAESRYERLPELAADLVRQKVAVIVAATTPAAVVAKAATKSIPIIFEIAGDPVALGLVGSLNRPEGNITGVTQLSSVSVPKRVGLLHEMLPAAKTIGLLLNPNDPKAEAQSREVEAPARALGLRLEVVKATAIGEFEAAFALLAERRADALIVGSSELLSRGRAQLAELAARHAIPTIYQYRDYVEAGGLISYGASLATSYRQVGVYAGRILKGAKPVDLPVMQVSKFELVINLKTAKALNLEIPPSLLAIADEVIE